jgi:glycosyltransferase involved in cell wall biosynthesis
MKMRIFALSLIKDEADIIAYTLEEASKWATKIFVLDNGSTDGTWEIVNKISKTNDKIVPWKQSFEPFCDEMRSEIFNYFSKEANKNDWWCFRLDADEVYAEDPREFLRKVPSYYDYVCKKSIDYVLTAEDLRHYNFDDHTFERNLKFIRYFLPEAWVEARFFRHKEKITWKESQELPKLNGLVFSKTILVKHYQYRSPDQMQNRLNVRNSSKDNVAFTLEGKQRWVHINETSWKELIRKRSEVLMDMGVASYQKVQESNPVKYPWYKFLVKALLLKCKVLK